MGAERFAQAVDQYGALLCPLVMVEWEEIEDATTGEVERCVPRRRPCLAELYLNWSFSIPVGSSDNLIRASDAHPSAVAHGWELVCTEGHMLAKSQAEESAEPFSLHAYFS